MRRKINNPSDYPGFLIWQASNDWHRQLDSLLASFDLTYVQFLLLVNLDFISSENRYVNQKDLVEIMNADKNLISQVLKRLELKKLIKRKVDKNDTRSKLVFLTADGNKKVLQTQGIIDLKDFVFLQARLNDISVFVENLRLIQLKKGGPTKVKI